jgi:3-oxoadipate enol-lactonase
MEATMPHAPVNGIDLYYEDTGEGLPLLLITGLSGNTLDWTPLLPALAEHYRVIAIDPRGAGRSSAPPGPYTTAMLAADALGLLDHLDLERAHVVGFSLGGMIAQEMAITAPSRVDRLVLLATAAHLRPAIIEPWLRLFVHSYTGEADAAGFAVWALPWWFSPSFMHDPGRIEAALAEMNDPAYPAAPAHGVAAQADAVRTHDTRARLGTITVPTLALVGADDIATPVVAMREVAEGIPAARLQVLEEGGHLVFAEFPDAVAEAIVAFLAG